MRHLPCCNHPPKIGVLHLLQWRPGVGLSRSTPVHWDVPSSWGGVRSILNKTFDSELKFWENPRGYLMAESLIQSILIFLLFYQQSAICEFGPLLDNCEFGYKFYDVKPSFTLFSHIFKHEYFDGRWSVSLIASTPGHCQASPPMKGYICATMVEPWEDQALAHLCPTYWIRSGL